MVLVAIEGKTNGVLLLWGWDVSTWTWGQIDQSGASSDFFFF